MAAATPLRKIGLMEQFHVTRHFLGLDSCVVGSAKYTSDDGARLTKENLFPGLRMLIEAHVALGLQLQGDEATANVFLVRLPSIDLARVVSFSDHQDLQVAYERQLARGFETQRAELPLWRVEVLADNTVLFAFHHAIADGMSSMAFHVHLLRALGGIESKDAARDFNSIVKVSSTTTLLPAVDRAISVRPSFGTLRHELYKLLVPVRFTSAHKAWTGWPCSPTPDLAGIQVRLLTLPAPLVSTLLAACREHSATLTAAIFVLMACVVSRLLPDSDSRTGKHATRWTSIGAHIALSMRGAAGIDNLEICDYPSVYHTSAPVRAELSWSTTAQISRKLQAQKTKGGEIIGCLRFLFGKFVPYFKGHLGSKREAAFVISNLGRWNAAVGAREGMWGVSNAFFGQSDCVTGAAFAVNVTGDPSGALNFTFTCGEKNLDTGFMEKAVARFEEAFLEFTSERK